MLNHFLDSEIIIWVFVGFVLRDKSLTDLLVFWMNWFLAVADYFMRVFGYFKVVLLVEEDSVLVFESFEEFFSVEF